MVDELPKFLVVIIALLFTVTAAAAGTSRPQAKPKAAVGVARKPVAGHARSASTRSPLVRSAAVGKAGKRLTPAQLAQARRAAYRYRWVETWREPNYANPTEGDDPTGEDPLVRQAAIDALGNFNGTLVAMDPSNGRVLSIVNQKLAFQPGFTPCSTIKLVTSLAALSEGLVDRTTQVALSRRHRLDMTDALAKSDNAYFAVLGEKMGFDKVVYYARMYGLGEKAGLNIPDEQPGSIAESPEKTDGVGMMCSFGNGFKVTPLNLAALVGAIATNGTLHYLQYPRTAEALKDLKPAVKRQLPISAYAQELLPGMMGAVEFGTARRAAYDQDEAPYGLLYGKTGTCTNTTSSTHMGWFGSFNQIGNQKVVAVVMLTGGRAVNGPVASGVAGAFFRNLAKNSYFKPQQPVSSASSPDKLSPIFSFFAPSAR
jgi:membrane peptidoglycan carboxypeptidase